MAYVALYRAYRPQKFSEVVGQKHIIKTLQNAIAMNKVAHAYLFCGPRGTGKTTLAKIMAKALNCEHGPAIEPCDECEICQGIKKGTVSDVIEIDAASNNGADDIRALRDTVKYLPAVGKYKVYIIDEVHMLSTQAFNALLKTLEEPPKHVIFILATTEPYKLPNTILSRCQRFDFQSISIDEITYRLKIVANEENISITDEAIYQIAASAEGGMRDALSLFDQCISFSTNESITLDDVLFVSGNVSYIKIIELLKACNSTSETEAALLLDSLIKEGKEVPRIVNDIILFLRDALLYKNNAIIEQKLMYDNSEFKELCASLPKGVIYAWLDILNNALNQMRFSTQKRAYLELAILKMNDNKLNKEANFDERISALEAMVSALATRPIAEMSHSEPEKPREIKVNIAPKPGYSAPVYEEPIAPQEPKPVVIPQQPENDSDEITIGEVENILNNASKANKEKLMAVWGKISEAYPNVFPVQILVNGKLVAVSDNSFIAVLNDTGFCNRVMSYENYVKIIEIMHEFDLNITDYICLPSSLWSKIAADYLKKYNAQTNPKPHLDEIRIGIKRRSVPQVTKTVSEDDMLANNVKEYFDDLKIMEE